MTERDEQQEAPPFRDAEAWLAERGIERQPIRLPTGEAAPGDSARRPRGSAGGRQGDRPPGSAGPASGQPQDPPGRLEDEIGAAVAFVRRSTARSPQSEQRLADKLSERGHPAVAVEEALARCREEGIVDDQAMAEALAEEGRRKGHARRRIGRDLRRRGLSSETIDTVLGSLAEADDEAVAAELAARRARELADEDTETAFRRVVGYLARRGHAAGLARRVARQVVLDGDPEAPEGGR